MNFVHLNFLTHDNEITNPVDRNLKERNVFSKQELITITNNAQKFIFDTFSATFLNIFQFFYRYY